MHCMSLLGCIVYIVQIEIPFLSLSLSPVASKSLGLTSGMVVAVPIPEKFAADARAVQEAQDKALAEAK